MQVKPDKPPPPHFKLGAGAHYTRLDVLADLLGTTDKGVRTLLAAFELPVAKFPGTSGAHYILTYAFESAMFNLGMPQKIKDQPDLLRVHQELAGLLYGALTREALKERVKQLARSLTSSGDKATIGRKKRTNRERRTWSGRTPS